MNDRPLSADSTMTRARLFEAHEKPLLKTLPPEPVEIGRWCRHKVPPDYHVVIEGVAYSTLPADRQDGRCASHGEPGQHLPQGRARRQPCPAARRAGDSTPRGHPRRTPAGQPSGGVAADTRGGTGNDYHPRRRRGVGRVDLPGCRASRAGGPPGRRPDAARHPLRHRRPPGRRRSASTPMSSPIATSASGWPAARSPIRCLRPTHPAAPASTRMSAVPPTITETERHHAPP